jgi:hypothetical protein
MEGTEGLKDILLPKVSDDITANPSANPIDINDDLNKDLTRKNNEDAKIAKASAEGDAEAEYLQKFINDNANPNPVVLIGLIFTSMILIYIIYYLFLRGSMNGEWYTDKGDKWYIHQNMLTNSLCVSSDKKYKGTAGVKLYGSVKSNYVEFSGHYGIWNGYDRLFLLDGTVMTKVSN